jgi:O-antigen/teichoic acid export membrane protein
MMKAMPLPAAPSKHSGAQSLGGRVAHGVLRLFSGRLVAMAVQFAAFALIASRLGPSQMGEFTLALAIASMFQMATDLGLQSVVERSLAQQSEPERRLVGSVVYLRLTIAAGTYAFLVVIAFLASFSPTLRSAVLIAGLLIFIGTLDSFRPSLQVRLRAGPMALGGVIGAVNFLIGVLALGPDRTSVEALLWLYLATTMVSLCFVAIPSWRLVRPDWRPTPTLWPNLLRAALPIGFTFFMNFVYYRIDLVILGALKPADEVGQYGVAYRFIDSLMPFPGLVMVLLSPLLAGTFTTSMSAFRRRYDRALFALEVMAVPIAVGGAMTAWRLLPALPGFGRYAGAGVALSVLLVAFSAMLVGHLVQASLVGAHLQGRLIRISAVGLAVNLLANAALIPLYGYVGASVATVLTESGVCLLSALTLKRHTGAPVVAGGTMRLLVPAVAMALAMVPAYVISSFAQIAIGLCTYILALGVTRTVTGQDLNEIGMTVRRRGRTRTFDGVAT